MTNKTITIFIILVIEIIVTIFLGKKVYKNCETLFEKTLFIVLIISIYTPLIIYILDSYNIPTLLTWNNNVNTQNWLSSLLTYTATIYGAIISVIFLYFTTLKQIFETNELNELSRKEDKRVSNQPILEYYFDESINNDISKQTLVLNTKSPEENSTNTLNIRIKNVGMNTARKCFVKINSEILEEEYCFQVETGQGSKLINKDDSRLIELFLNFKSNKYKFNIKIYYQDLLFNWYEQKIVLDYELTQKFYNNKQINNKIIKILDEKLLDKEPILITNIEAINI